jgi:hypothetical protein
VPFVLFVHKSPCLCHGRRIFRQPTRTTQNIVIFERLDSTRFCYESIESLFAGVRRQPRLKPDPAGSAYSIVTRDVCWIALVRRRAVDIEAPRI